MKKVPSHISESIIYRPNTLKGKSLFNGTPKPTENVLQTIGVDGVNHIHQRLNEIVNFQKEIHGNWKTELYGLFYFQSFYDLTNRIQISVYQIIDNEDSKDLQPYKLEIEGNYYLSDNNSDRVVKKHILSGANSLEDHLEYLPRGEENIYPKDKS